MTNEEYLKTFWEWVPEDWRDCFEDEAEINEMALGFKSRGFPPHLGALELFK